jgi:hypothetical protein
MLIRLRVLWALTLEIEAVADEGFSDNDVSVVKDNARQLKFKPESTGFED